MAKLADIMKKIDNNEIMLPDFQRDFVWRDEDLQKQLVASILCKMPVGSILLLTANPDEYAAKVIGSTKEVDISNLKHEVDFLLDGQQRITVMANVFSNVIHDNCEKVTDLIAPMALKKRFFISIPKWKNKPKSVEDWFGIGKLVFPMEDPGSDLPVFLSSDISSYICVKSFTASDSKPYNPKNPLSTDLDNECLAKQDDCYLIPLFLMCPGKKNRDKIILRYNEILQGVAENIKKEIMNQYVSYAETEDKQGLIKDIFDEDADNIIDNDMELERNKFDSALNDRQLVWKSEMDKYLKSCIDNLELGVIRVPASQRGRAIDIYENLNRGGVCLNTFDLVMARVAKVDKDSHENFQKRIIKRIEEAKKYPDGIIPKILKNELDITKYNASMKMGVYNKNKKELNSTYIDVFLDVLGILCKTINLTSDEVKLDYVKKNTILNLEPEKIDNSCETVINAIDRALFFLQTRCGERTIKDVKYSLMIALVAVVFIDEEKFKSKDVHELLEAWYWASLFSGEYAKDQNKNFINNLNKMLGTIYREEKCSWIEKMEDSVFQSKNYTDEDYLLMKRVDDDRIPSKSLRAMLCKYMLSRPYSDMFDDKLKISVFCDEANDLEAHHIVPLGSTKKYGEATAVFRDNPKHICNSPLNFVYVTKKSNKEISDKPLDKYVKDITISARKALFITKYKNEINDEVKISEVLKDRFDLLVQDVKDRIDDCLINWK